MSEHVVSFHHLPAAELEPLFPGVEFTRVSDLTPSEDIEAALETATIIIAPLQKERRITEAQLLTAKNCRLVQTASVGFDGIEYRNAQKLGIPVSNNPGFNAPSVADWAVMGMLMMLKRVREAHAQVIGGGWDSDALRGHDLSEQTVGLLGFGDIGRNIAQRLDGFGTRVVVNDIMPVEKYEQLSLEEVLSQSNIVSVQLPLNHKTEYLITAEKLELLPPGAIVVNVGRGRIIDAPYLAQMLASGRLGGAVLDVFAVEPLPADSPFRRLSNVILSPHSAAETWESHARQLEGLRANVQRVLDGEEPQHVINAPVAARV